MKKNTLIISSLLAIIMIACQPQSKSSEREQIISNVNIPYNVSNPSEIKYLKKELKEISGLTYLGDNKIACVQDEKGIVYIMDNFGERINRKIKFKGKGDFEGITFIKDKFYVNRSDGHIYPIDINGSDDQDSKAIKTPLSEKNDIEGITYFNGTNELWLACKSEGGIEHKLKKKRAIYAYDLTNNKFIYTPKITIDYQEVNDKLGAPDNYRFKPSGLAIHPQNKQLYIVCSVGKCLIVTDLRGNLKEAVYLPKDTFSQPEGITFDEIGNMFISNEGVNGKANILKFNIKNL